MLTAAMKHSIMKHRIALASVLVLTAWTATAPAGGPDIRACDFTAKRGCVSGDARVTLVDGEVKRVEVDVYWCALPGRPGYTCLIDSSRGDGDATWSDEGGATLIDNTSPLKWNPNAPDRVKVTVGPEVSIELAEAQSLGRCGAGAALPLAIIIPANTAACRVRLRAP